LESLEKSPSTISKEARRAIQIAAQTSTPDDAFFWVKFTRNVRDGVRKFIQTSINHNFYPIVKVNETPRANYWARAVLEKLEQPEVGKINLDELNAELLADIQELKKYPQEVTQIGAVAATLASRKLALKNVSYKDVVNADHQIPYFYYIPDPSNSGALIRKAGHIPFVNDVHFEITVSHLYPWFPWLRRSVEEKNLHKAITQKAKEHVYRLSKLIVFYSEYFRFTKLEGAAAKNPAHIQLIEEMASLFENNSLEVKKDFRVSEDVYQILKWRLLWGEIKAMGANPNVQEVFDIIKTLPESEKKLLSIEKFSEHFKLWQRTRGGVVLAPLIGTGTGVGVWKLVYNFVFQDTLAKEECAQKATDAEFNQCAFEYLKFKAQTQSIFFDVTDFTSLLDQSGRITNPALLAEMSDLISRRHAFLFAKNIEDAIENPVQNQLAESNLASEAFLNGLITTVDEAHFKQTLLSTDPKNGFLMFNFPVAFMAPGIQDLVKKIVSTKDFDEREGLFFELSSFNHTKKLSEALRHILEAREQYLKTGQLKESIKPLLDLFLIALPKK
jgi:hypothetical protein